MQPTLLFFAGMSAGAALSRNQSCPALPTVNLGYQTHQAISFNKEFQTFNFTNIPYGEPPLGDLRFLPPVAPRGRKQGIQNGSEGKVCHQANPFWLGIGLEFLKAFATGNLPLDYAQVESYLHALPPQVPDGRSTEDCLVLDVLVPKSVMSQNHPKRGAPVLVWIYGGGYVTGEKTMFGSPDMLMAETRKYAPDGAIWVSMNYRLGAFGFLSSPLDGIANAGLLDQRLALQWVQEHIEKFGGDPDNVTIMGDSSAGGSIMHHITAFGGREKALFQRAITQSPGFLPNSSPQQQQDTLGTFLARLGVKTVQEARGLSSSALVAANAQQVLEAPYGTFVFGPVVDFDYVPALPTKLLSHGQYVKDIRVFSSYAQNEGLLFTDPRSTINETRLREQIQGALPQISTDNLNHLLTTLYPPDYTGMQPYRSALDRAQLIFGEMAFLCNHNALLQATSAQGIPGFGELFDIWPAGHGGDQPFYFPHEGSAPTDLTSAAFMKDTVASFVMTGSPSAAIMNGSFIPVYGKNGLLLELTGNGSTTLPDPTTSERCNWWHTAVYY